MGNLKKELDYAVQVIRNLTDPEMVKEFFKEVSEDSTKTPEEKTKVKNAMKEMVKLREEQEEAEHGYYTLTGLRIEECIRHMEALGEFLFPNGELDREGD